MTWQRKTANSLNRANKDTRFIEMRYWWSAHRIVEGDSYGGQDPERVVEPKLMMVRGVHEISNINGLGILNFVT